MRAWVVWILAVLGLGLFLSLMLESPDFAGPFVSTPTWLKVVQWLGGTVDRSVDGSLTGFVPWPPLLLISAVTLAGLWWGAAWFSRELHQNSLTHSADQLSGTLWPWWLLPGVWSVAWLTVSIIGWGSGMQFLGGCLDLVLAASLGALVGVLLHSLPRFNLTNPQSLLLLGGLIFTYIVTYTAMNWGLWFNLRLPHGDSSMYEEHLWNLLHGKGFRSYLDQGLFLGEHIQVVHVLFVPLYIFWPSHLLLELLESTALASGAIPVYFLAKRHSGSPGAALGLATAYLLYFPMHYLDIAVDLKTFRPNAFGIPLLLWTLDSIEKRLWGRVTLFSMLTLTCQEDYAIPLGLIGFWLLVTSWWNTQEAATSRRIALIAGGTLWLLSIAYLAFVLKVAFPYFREGAEIHYVSYFQKFGNSASEVVWNMFTRPGLLLKELLSPEKLIYAAQLLIPLAGLPFRSPSRLLTAVPLFVLLCLNELAQQPPSPVHHFHAPLIPLLFWAAAAGLGTHTSGTSPTPGSPEDQKTRNLWLSYSLGMALTTAILFSMSPLGLKFWDPGRSTYWKSLYLPDERAREFEKIAPLIPLTARVASTDFVHPRFTHCERSYDYSKYPRRVANYEDKVPDDTDYIVIDFQHPYSEVRSLDQIRELQRAPEQWELLTDPQNTYFAVLKRR